MAENTLWVFIPFPSSPNICSAFASSPKENFLSITHRFSHPTFLSVYVRNNRPLQGVGLAAGMCPCSLWITCIISFHITNHNPVHSWLWISPSSRRSPAVVLLRRYFCTGRLVFYFRAKHPLWWCFSHSCMMHNTISAECDAGWLRGFSQLLWWILKRAFSNLLLFFLNTFGSSWATKGMCSVVSMWFLKILWEGKFCKWCKFSLTLK